MNTYILLFNKEIRHSGSLEVVQKSTMIFLVLNLLVAMVVADSCYAPPRFYSGVCSSPTSLVGDNQTNITYYINALGDSSAECQGLGSPNHQPFGMYDLGLFNDQSNSATIFWGNNTADPAIKCKGSPFGTAINWKWFIN